MWQCADGLKRRAARPVRWPLGLVLVGWLLALSAAAQIPERPNPPRLVNDYAQLLSPDEVARLEQKLVAYDDSTSSQIAIVTVPTLGDYEVADFGQQLGEKWGVGGRANNNGILVLVAKQERAINISTGYGMEARLPDMVAKRVIEQQMKPAFRENRYYDGLDQATTSLIQIAAGSYRAPEGYAERGARSQGEGDGLPLWLIIVVVLLVLWLLSRRGGGGGGRSNRGWGGGFFPPVILGGGGGGGWGGGGSSGGGGFGGFGGGSFGGGGASGNW